MLICVVSLIDSEISLYASTLAIHAAPDPNPGFNFDGDTDFYSNADPDPFKMMRIRIQGNRKQHLL
jgi:hypothetical protein